jgi:hypothetical protein
MASIEQSDEAYRLAIENVPKALIKSFECLVSAGALPVSGSGADLTCAILLRLRTYDLAQYRIRDWLEKKYRAPSDHFFVETILFYLRALSISHRLDLKIVSEERLEMGNGSALRPDISIFRNGVFQAVIECKTQLVFDRIDWETRFLHKEERLHETYPNARMFLVVATAKNWGGMADSAKRGDQYFVLCKKWLTDYDAASVANVIDTPIEPLFRQILEFGR